MSLEKEIPPWVTEYNNVPIDSTGRRVSRVLGDLISKGDRKIDELQEALLRCGTQSDKRQRRIDELELMIAALKNRIKELDGE